MRSTFFITLALLAFSVATPTAKAYTATYIYTGHSFNDFIDYNNPATNTGPGFITASFTFASALPDNANRQGYVPVSWTTSNQVTTYSSSNGDQVGSFFFSTDTLGNIINWYTVSAAGSYSHCSGSAFCPYPVLVTTYGFVGVDLDASQIWCGGGIPCGQASISDAPGTWIGPNDVASPVPEPSTVLLTSSGGTVPLLAMIYRRRKYSPNPGRHITEQ